MIFDDDEALDLLDDLLETSENLHIGDNCDGKVDIVDWSRIVDEPIYMTKNDVDGYGKLPILFTIVFRV